LEAALPLRGCKPLLVCPPAIQLLVQLLLLLLQQLLLCSIL
jgi:hypothetical protein